MKSHQIKLLATAVSYWILVYLWGHVLARFGMVWREIEGAAYLVFSTPLQSQLPPYTEKPVLTPQRNLEIAQRLCSAQVLRLAPWNSGDTTAGLSQAKSGESFIKVDHHHKHTEVLHWAGRRALHSVPS